jgi:hypothetical protein
MTETPQILWTRRRALMAGGASAAALAGVSAGQGLAQAEAASGGLPVDAIERIVNAKGTVSGGVLNIELDRDDIGDVHGPLGVVFTPSFQINGNLCFQPLAGGRALLNGDLALKPDELQPFIDALLRNGLIFQAFHQHIPDLEPQVWFMHFRGIGGPLDLARAIHDVIAVTSTPLPQAPPPHPHTPLDPGRLGAILHGSAQVGAEGVVTVTVLRKGRYMLGGVPVSPETNISTNVEFKPLGGSRAAAVPDFSMTEAETQPVMRTMRAREWFVGCLYNQETDEFPQLFFSHQLKVGNAYELAAEIRLGLDQTNSE